jgi:hypothetical protein
MSNWHSFMYPRRSILYFSSTNYGRNIKIQVQKRDRAANLCGNTNDTASRAGTSVTGLLGLLVTTLAKVISTGVDDQSAAQNGLGTNQLDKLILHGAVGVTLGIGLEVAKVTNVTLGVSGSTVGLAEGVEVGTSGGAAVGVVTELVNVESTLSVGVVAGDVPGDGGGGTFVSLLEGDGAGNLSVTTEDSNCKERKVVNKLF